MNERDRSLLCALFFSLLNCFSSSSSSHRINKLRIAFQSSLAKEQQIDVPSIFLSYMLKKIRQIRFETNQIR